MKKVISLIISMFLVSCVSEQVIKNVADYNNFVRSDKYSQSYAIYENEDLMEEANEDNTSIEIDLKQQRLKLLVDGDVALDSPTTTGSKKKKDINDDEVKDKRTPKGTFAIIEKKEHKQSTTYGKLYKEDEEVYYGDRRKFKGEYDRYEGVEMPYWMRVVGAVGIHESEVIVRNTGSNGCVRLPAETAVKVYFKVKEGTKVVIK